MRKSRATVRVLGLLLLLAFVILFVQCDSKKSDGGSKEKQEKSEFTLWEWGGNWISPTAGLAKKMDLSPKMKPEGITRVEVRDGTAAQSFVFVIGDASSYIRVDSP